MSIDKDQVSVSARRVPLREVLRELAAAADLRLVQHVPLDRIVSLGVDAGTLPDALDEILADFSYQLYQAAPGDADDKIPGTLWIFSKGSSQASAATIFFEAVVFHGSYAEKKEAIRELRHLGTPAAVEALSLALNDGDARVRNTAFEALSRIESDEALAAIASATNDSDPWVRSEAAQALAAGDGASAIEYLALAFHDPNPKVRMSVVEAFADIPGERAAAILSQALRDEDPDVRMHAVGALEEVGDETALRAMLQSREDEDPDVAEAIRESLDSMRGGVSPIQ